MYREPIYSILIDTNLHTLYLYSDDELYKSYPVAVGKPSTPSPKGKFKVLRKSKNPGGPYGARWINFKPHYGIHGTNRPLSIGKSVSGGCIRLHNEDIIELYDLIEVRYSCRNYLNLNKKRTNFHFFIKNY